MIAWTGVSLSAPPTTQPTPEDETTGIAATDAGSTCGVLASVGFSYAEAVAYWRQHPSDDSDPNDNGIPCETAYTDTEVAEVYAGSGALPVHIVSTLWQGTAGTFVATGPAVEAGIICPAGTQQFTDDPSPTHEGAMFRWEDRYTCDDGTGTVLIGADVFITDEDHEYGVWNIISGTGRYESLTGGGDSATGPIGTEPWSDDMVGRLMIVDERS